MAESANRPAQDRGTTTFADVVVAKTAGMAAREVGGVHALGNTAAQMMGAVRRRVGGGEDVTSGVSVEVGEEQTSIDVSLVVEYGQAIHKVAQRVRESIVTTVERTTGLEVTEVNIAVTDVHLEGESET